ncbi:MAG: response regulator [Halobacteriales archaeon SW_9_67_25]|nr:MAG: response regulator [Halobacteriales archaeon SW_9_67_25]
MPDTNSEATILVVDDEQKVVESYSLRLGMRYDDVHTATGGREALAFLEVSDPDVIFLDRRMPDMSGDEVAEMIREEGYDTQVIMATAVDPDFDIVEMPFDDYLQKPIGKEEMFGAVEQQLNAGAYEGKRAEYFSVRSKIAVIEEEKSSYQLEDNTKYQELLGRARELEAALDGTVAEFDDISDR